MYLLLDRPTNITMNCGNYDHNVTGARLFNSLLESKVNRSYSKYFHKSCQRHKIMLIVTVCYVDCLYFAI